MQPVGTSRVARKLFLMVYSTIRIRALALLTFLLASASLAAASPAVAPQWAVAGKPGVHKKLGSELPMLQSDFLDHLAKQGAAAGKTFRPATEMLRVSAGFVLVDLVAIEDATSLRADLIALGATDVSVHKSMVSARVPISALDQIGDLSSLKFARPSLFTTWAGSTTSQGDVAQRSNAARTSFGVDGTGVTVGVLSNSYDCAAAAAGDVSSGDLPTGVTVLLDSCPDTDEGRAMMQIVHDAAPGAAMAFHSASGGQAAFANGINNLVVAGADVIVDDVFYFGEPMFQDGVIAQAVDAAVANGSAYFSSAGNAAAASYEATFVNSGVTGPNTGRLHDFDPGPGTVTAQALTVPVGTTFTLVLQWNQPFFAVSGAPGAATDVDVFLTAANGTTILARSENSNIGNDAIEAFEFTNTGALPQGADTRFFLKIENFRGPDPDLIKYMYTDSGGGVTIDQFDTQDGTSYGHSSAAGAMSTGAVAYNETPAFGTTPPRLEPFSSRGDVPIYFQTNGTAISPPELRLKPGIVAPDRVNNTFFGNDSDGDGFPNFAGTSAAAPHAAGAAALLLDFNATLTPAQIYSALADSTIEMLSGGFDFDSGFGLIQADAAISSLSNAPPALNAISGRIVAAGGSVSIPVSASDPDGPNPTLSTPVIPGFCSLAGTNGSGNVNCSPTTAHVGRHAVVVTAADSGTPVRSDSEGFYVVVTGTATNSAPILSAIGDQSVEEAATLVIPLSATDPNGDGMTLSQSGLPGFCSLTDNSNGSGNITCNPLTGNTGTYPTTVTVTDNGSPNLADSELFDIVVTAPVANRAPVLTLISNQSVDENASLSIPLSAADADGDSMILSSSGLPAFCSLNDNLNGSGNISCNPSTGDNGTYTTTVTVTDNGTPNLADSDTFDIVVNTTAANRAPRLSNIQDGTVTEGETLIRALSATDRDGNALTFSATGLPAFCVLRDFGDGSGDITCNPVVSNAGTYTVTVTVTDDGTPNLSNSRSFDIVVTAAAANQAPVLGFIGNQSVIEDATLVVPLSASDPDVNSMTLSQTGLPGFCSLTDNLNGTGNITCNPLTGNAGTYPITVTVTDNGSPNLTDFETFDIVVSAPVVNQAPVLAAIGNQSVDENATLVVPISANDPDANSVAFTQVGLPGFCALIDNLNGTGNITCNPLTGNSGTYPVTVTVTDNGSPNLTDLETFDIVVSAPVVNQAPILKNIGDRVAKENKTLDIDIEASDPDGDTLVFSTTNLPLFCSLTDNADGTGIISCSPSGLDVGTYTYTITVTDNGSSPLSDSETISMRVRARSTMHDMNGDGMSDIVWRNDVTGQNWLYLMDGATITSSIGINTVPLDWQIVGNGDYNDDGKNDVLWRNSVTGQNWLYLMNGATIASSVGVNTISDLTWEVAGSGDYNGDGMADILWRNSVTGQNWLYIMNGSAIVSSVGINSVPPDWDIAGSGDQNGDGMADILWRNSITGQNWLYLMNVPDEWFGDHGQRRHQYDRSGLAACWRWRLQRRRQVGSPVAQQCDRSELALPDGWLSNRQ